MLSKSSKAIIIQLRQINRQHLPLDITESVEAKFASFMCTHAMKEY